MFVVMFPPCHGQPFEVMLLDLKKLSTCYQFFKKFSSSLICKFGKNNQQLLKYNIVWHVWLSFPKSMNGS